MRKTFGNWLSGQLLARHMKQAGLSRATGLDTRTINHLVHGKHNPDADECEAISRALNIPLQEVVRAAGILAPIGQDDPVLHAAIQLMIDMDTEDREQVLEFARDRRRQAYKKLGSDEAAPHRNTKLVVMNLTPQIGDHELLSLFLQAGPVRSARVTTKPDKDNTFSRGVVEMATMEDADMAIRMFHGKYWNGHRLSIDYKVWEDG